jgi:negative regulator of flagellin synthesis FlgM
MKIRDDAGLSRGIPAPPRPIQGTRPDSSDRTEAGGKTRDRVELSDQARALHAAKESLAQLPQVRADKVAALQESINSGSYQISGSEIAQRMLGDGFLI